MHTADNNQIPNSDAFFLDATPQEELACPDRIHVWFTPDGRVCGMRIEGESGTDAQKIKDMLMVSAAQVLQGDSLPWPGREVMCLGHSGMSNIQHRSTSEEEIYQPWGSVGRTSSRCMED